MYLVFVHLTFRKLVRIGLAWLNLFIIQQFNNLIEALFFTTYLSSVTLFLGAVIAGLIFTFIEALIIGLFFIEKGEVRSYVSELKGYFSERSNFSWIIRIIIAMGAYFPVYFIFGSLIASFVILISPSIMPAQLRIFHGFEILADSIVYGAILAYLFGRHYGGQCSSLSEISLVEV